MKSSGERLRAYARGKQAGREAANAQASEVVRLKKRVAKLKAQTAAARRLAKASTLALANEIAVRRRVEAQLATRDVDDDDAPLMFATMLAGDVGEDDEDEKDDLYEETYERAVRRMDRRLARCD